MGSFFDDIGDGFKSIYSSVLKPIGEKAYNFGDKVLNRFDKISDAGDRVIGNAADAAAGLSDFLSGKGNTLLYIGLGVAALVILPKVIDRVL